MVNTGSPGQAGRRRKNLGDDRPTTAGSATTTGVAPAATAPRHRSAGRRDPLPWSAQPERLVGLLGLIPMPRAWTRMCGRI